TQALLELLGSGSRVYAVDRDPRAIGALGRRLSRRPELVPVVADFTRPFTLPGLQNGLLDGILLANALHYVREADAVLTRLVSMLRPGGQLVLVEYDRRAANPWVPYPIPLTRLEPLVAAAGLSPAAITATRPSAFGGSLYVATADRPG